MSKITITEALAEIKTIDKRIQKKREFINAYLYRQDALKDPLERDGGSHGAILREAQSIHDLAERKVAIRREIANANAETKVACNGTERSISDWLVWRREVAPGIRQFYSGLRSQIDKIRTEAARAGYVTVAAGAEARPGDVVINIDEMKLAEDAEQLEETLGQLDGLLSLKNATTFIEL